MEQDGMTFYVDMKAKDLFRFKMYHVYHGISGIFGILLTLIALILLIVNFNTMPEQSRVVMILIVVWFVVIDPIRFYTHSVKQAKLNPVYRKPLGYKLDENGITVFQDETEQTLGWEQIVKVAETGKQFIVYSSKIHAFIFPKESLGDESDLLRKMLSAYTEGKNIKIKGISKDNSEKTEV